MAVLTVHRNRILRLHQGIDQLDLLLAGMSGNMDILEDYVGTLHRQLVDNARYSFFISRNRIGTKNDRIVRLDRHFLVHAACHAGQCCHRLALASRRDDDGLLIRVTLQLLNVD